MPKAPIHFFPSNSMSAVDQKLVKRQRFEGVFSQIVEELLQFLQSQNMPKEAVDLSLIHISEPTRPY